MGHLLDSTAGGSSPVIARSRPAALYPRRLISATRGRRRRALGRGCNPGAAARAHSRLLCLSEGADRGLRRTAQTEEWPDRAWGRERPRHPAPRATLRQRVGAGWSRLKRIPDLSLRRPPPTLRHTDARAGGGATGPNRAKRWRGLTRPDASPLAPDPIQGSGGGPVPVPR